MDDLTGRLRAEKSKARNATDLTAHNETLRRLSDDVDAFIDGATGSVRHLAGVQDASSERVYETACGSQRYQPYDVGDALTSHHRANNVERKTSI